MADTVWADVSQFQRTVNDDYPHRVFAFRANDGEYVDKNFHDNHHWARQAADRGDLDVFIVYCVFEPGLAWATTLMQQVGDPHPKMAVMIDAESWGGKIGGDHSHDLNEGREKLISWLDGNRARVIGYGNVGDLNELWPSKGDTKVVVAAYGTNPTYPGKIAHQYTSSGSCAPFGSPVDLNSADGKTPAQFAQELGINEEDDMPLSHDDVVRVSEAVWEYESKMNDLKFGDMNRAVYDSMRYGQKGVRTTGDGLSELLDRLGRIELKLDELSK